MPVMENWRFTARAVVSVLVVASAAGSASVASADSSPPHRALVGACLGDPGDVVAVRDLFPASRVLDARVQSLRGRPGRARHVLGLASGDELRLVRIFPGGRLRRITVEHHAVGPGTVLRPRTAVAADGNCREIETRRITYGPDAKAAHLSVIRGGVQIDTPLNPAVPAGRDPGGVLVAVIDTGVNYELPNVTARLARDDDGALVGYDFWDDDDRPFDLDTGRSAFFPLHHGTAVTSIILREAPSARIAPYRFPRPDMTRMDDVIGHAARAGARIVNLAMGSNRPTDWEAFEAAARSHPHMLFVVSAGNDGRDIDTVPVYPAALDLDNMITVTSADSFGKLADGSNWGRRHVDVMVPGERVPVIDHRGVRTQASGSSFAVPRVSALAARWLDIHPTWAAADLKRALLSRARPSPRQPTLPVRHGWIPDPTDDFLAK